jgi:hypothetical protein
LLQQRLLLDRPFETCFQKVNSRNMVKDIAKHSILITYILRYHNVNVDKNNPLRVHDDNNQIIKDSNSLNVNEKELDMVVKETECFCPVVIK